MKNSNNIPPLSTTSNRKENVSTRDKYLSNLWAIVMDQLNNLKFDAPNFYSKEISNMIKEGIDLMPEFNGWRPLPNVRKFQITELAPLDPILHAAGIDKRSGKPIIEYTPYRNKKINRYVKWQFKRLRKNVHNPVLFWRIAIRLLTKSYSYITICYQRVNPNWHRNTQYHEVLTHIRKLCNLNLLKYEYTVIRIPKPDGSTRPLGGPTMAWRIFLHGLNNILLVYLSPYIPDNQHGFLPGRGTGTAWKAILSEATASRNIFEFDLNKFFDRVNLHYLERIFKVIGIPSDIAELLTLWHQTPSTNGEGTGQDWTTTQEEAGDYKY